MSAGFYLHSGLRAGFCVLLGNITHGVRSTLRAGIAILPSVGFLMGRRGGRSMQWWLRKPSRRSTALAESHVRSLVH